MNQTEINKIEIIRKAIEIGTGKKILVNETIHTIYFYEAGYFSELLYSIPNSFIEFLPIGVDEGSEAKPKIPYCCPVCYGVGTVPPNFYSQMDIGTSASREQCKSCEGKRCNILSTIKLIHERHHNTTKFLK